MNGMVFQSDLKKLLWKDQWNGKQEPEGNSLWIKQFSKAYKKIMELWSAAWTSSSVEMVYLSPLKRMNPVPHMQQILKKGVEPGYSSWEWSDPQLSTSTWESSRNVQLLKCRSWGKEMSQIQISRKRHTETTRTMS